MTTGINVPPRDCSDDDFEALLELRVPPLEPSRVEPTRESSPSTGSSNAVLAMRECQLAAMLDWTGRESKINQRIERTEESVKAQISLEITMRMRRRIVRYLATKLESVETTDMDGI